MNILKKKKAVSPVVATVLIIALVLAATSIVFLIVLPMLNLGPKPSLIFEKANAYKDYDNDGLCDFMNLQIMSVLGGANANITGVKIIWVSGSETGETSWQPLTDEDQLIYEGDSKSVKFIPLLDDTDEIPDGAEIVVSIISDESSVNVLEIPDPINVVLGDPVIVEFTDGSGSPIVGASIDFYFETGEYGYSGQSTGANGRSQTFLFPGHYYVRATEGFSLYYSDVFTHPGEDVIHLEVVGGILTVKVKAGSSPIQGAIVYVYDTFSHYLGKYSTTGADGITTFSLDTGVYKLRADVGGITYYSDDVHFPDETYVEIDTGGGDIYCHVIDGGNSSIPNVRVYLFRATGQYYGKYANTNGTGYALFTAVPGGILFKFRVDYLAYQLWSQEFGASPGSVIDVNVGGGTIYVNVTDGSGNPIRNTRTYLFTASGRYSGKYANTNATGIATYLRVAGGSYKIRVDYMARQFWSPIFDAVHGYIVQASIGGGTLFGNITAGGTPVVNTRVYLFTDTGRYTGRYGNTNASGIVEIQGVGEGNYRMRVDFQAYQHWSPVFYFNQTAVVDYDIGGGTVYANVTSGGVPVINTRVYVFTSTGRYTGTYANTNTSGIATFNTLSGGNYRFRVDYLARQFWSDEFTASNGLIVDVDLGGGTVYVHLTNNYNVDLSNVRIYLFTDTGRYTGKYANTNSSGIAIFAGIGEANYRFQADYLAKQYWSSVFLAQPDLLFGFNIGGGIVWMYVHDGSGTAITGARCYLFTDNGRYTGIYRNLNATGYIEFTGIGDGNFRWRVDYLAQQFWSPVFAAINNTLLDFNIGGGTIFVHLTVNGGDVSGGRIYLFTDTGRYTGKYADTNSTGWAVFYGIGNSTSTDYKLRYSYSGTYYWKTFTASPELKVEFVIITTLLLNFVTTVQPLQSNHYSTTKLFF
ncbi:MAG: hypothetical protein ACTSUR_04790 [Candidatus Heimdallarchaeaceae archaeon]